MLGIELQQTRIYQEAKAEGKTEEGRSLVVRLLTRKLGNLTPQLQERVDSLSIRQSRRYANDRLESLGEALLDFDSMTDLDNWLNQN